MLVGGGLTAIAWSGFDLDAVGIHRYDDASEPRCARNDDPCFLSRNFSGEMAIFKDPLRCAVGFGLLVPSYAYTCIRPDAQAARGLYRARIYTTHTVLRKSGSHNRESHEAAAWIDLFALAAAPEELMAALERGAAAARGAAATGMAPRGETMDGRDY